MTRLLSFFVIIMLILIGIYAFKISNHAGSPEKENQQTLDAFDFQNWHEFIDSEKKFKVLLPVLPQHATENIRDKNTGINRKYEVYVSEKQNGNIFMISVITFPSPPSDKDKDSLLRAMMNDMMESKPSNKLLKVEATNYKGFNSLDYSLENNEMHIDAKTFLANNILYVLTLVAKKESYNEKEFEFFINSFDISAANQNSK